MEANLTLQLVLWLGGFVVAILLVLCIVGFFALRIPPSRPRE
jgi:hypothetical protein